MVVFLFLLLLLFVCFVLLCSGGREVQDQDPLCAAMLNDHMIKDGKARKQQRVNLRLMQ